MNTTRVKIQIRLLSDEQIALGPGKVELLQAIAETGSISAAGRQMGMSYRRAWNLVSVMNDCFIEPLVLTATGGQHGGGAQLSETGKQIVQHYQRMMIAAATAIASDTAFITSQLKNR